MVLDLGEPSYDAHDDCRAPHGEFASQGARPFVDLGRPPEVEAERHDGHLVGGTDPIAVDEIVAHHLTDRDDAIAEPRKDALAPHEDLGDRRGEVPVKEVPVEGMHQPRAAPTPERGEEVVEEPRGAAKRPRLGRVCVDDVGPFTPHETEERDERTEIARQLHAAPEPRNDDRHHVMRLREIAHVAFTGIDEAGHEARLPTPFLEPRGEQDGVDGRSAGVQSRNDPQDPPRRGHAGTPVVARSPRPRGSASSMNRNGRTIVR